MESLPDKAVERLNDPRLFKLLVRDESESLYRVLPAFLSLDAPPAPASFEALRRAVPASTAVYLYMPETFRSAAMLRAGAALSHAQLLGVVDPATIHLRTPWQTEPLGDHVPDLVITPAELMPWMLPSRLAPADLVERQDRRLRARRRRWSDHAAAAAGRAVPV